MSAANICFRFLIATHALPHKNAHLLSPSLLPFASPFRSLTVQVCRSVALCLTMSLSLLLSHCLTLVFSVCYISLFQSLSFPPSLFVSLAQMFSLTFSVYPSLSVRLSLSHYLCLSLIYCLSNTLCLSLLFSLSPPLNRLPTSSVWLNSLPLSPCISHILCIYLFLTIYISLPLTLLHCL